MAATTTEGTGNGSVTKVKQPILNGVVKGENLIVDALKQYRIDIEAEGDINAGGNITANGYIRSEVAGQLLNTSLSTSTGTATASSDTDTDLLTVTYTPVSATSKLLIEFHTPYTVNGSGVDDFRSNIAVDGTEITYRDQVWANASGGGTRSSVIFPIVGIYTNSSVTEKTIKIRAKQNTSNDTLTVDRSKCVIKISEFAR